MIISKEENKLPTDVEKKLAEAAAIFIGRQME